MPREAEPVTIVAPSSSANVGPYYDVACLGLEQPTLKVTLTRKLKKGGIEVDIKTPTIAPQGRELGFAGKYALERLFAQLRYKEGVHLLYEDSGYPVGGLGRSGAEAVATVMAAVVALDVRMDREQIIKTSALAEPDQHMDNVAGSTNGRFNLITKSPSTDLFRIDAYDVPENLGIAIGVSSHQKTGGTEAGRKPLKEPVEAEDFVVQSGLIASATAALIKGNTDKFLELVWGDRYHEPRRANVGFYGNFNAEEFRELKKRLYNNMNIAINVSGAGPNMQFLYNKDTYPSGIDNHIEEVELWFKNHGIDLKIAKHGIAKGGAYDHAVQNYNY